MAKMNKMILGKVSGALGDITFRQRKGKNYVATRPGTFNAASDPGALERRGRFKLAGKLSSLIISFPELYLVWNSFFGKGANIYNKLIQLNYSKVKPDSFTNRTFIVPELGFGINIQSSSLGKELINVKLSPLGNKSSIDVSAEPSIRLFSILCFNDPKNTGDDAWFLVPLQSAALSFSLETALEFTIEPESNLETLFDQYNKKQLLFSLLTLDPAGSPVHWSGTALA